jgi:hypothetical protein
MHPTDKENLLQEIIAEGDYEEFRDALLKSSTRHFRRFHRRASLRKWLALAAALTVAATLLALFAPRKLPAPPISRAPAAISLQAPAALIVETTPGVTPIVRSRAFDDLDVVRSVPDLSLVVTTRRKFPEMSDEQLLALFRNEPAGFVRVNGVRKFILLNQLNQASSLAQ